MIPSQDEKKIAVPEIIYTLTHDQRQTSLNHSPTICINSTFPSPFTLAHTANGICTLRPKCALSHCTCPKTATSSPFAKEVSTSNFRPARCLRMSLKVCAMASGPV